MSEDLNFMYRARIAALVITAALVCLLAARVLTVDPPHPDHAIVDPQPGGPNAVPGPPPLPEVNTKQHAKKAEPQHIATTQPDAVETLPVEAESQPVILTGTVEAEPATQDTATLASLQTAGVGEHPGPVIVVPHERPKEENRGVRWIKSVGHALGLGAQDPVEKSFR